MAPQPCGLPRTVVFAVAAILLCGPRPLLADDTRSHVAPRTVRLLAIGNSLSQDATRWLRRLAQAAEEMYRGIRSAYRTMADALDAPVIPAGDAFHMALGHDRFRHRVDPAFEPARAVHPALPDQRGSLHVGWTWKRGEDGGWKLALDDRHASVAGSYLAGCVWLETLFDASSVGNPFVPPGLDPADARPLQEIAHRAVAARRAQPALVP